MEAWAPPALVELLVAEFLGDFVEVGLGVTEAGSWLLLEELIGVEED